MVGAEALGRWKSDGILGEDDEPRPVKKSTVLLGALGSQFLYVGDRNNSLVAGFRVNADASVTPVPNSPFPSTGGTTELLPVIVNF